MNRSLIILLVSCVLAAAMVPRSRRSVTTNNENSSTANIKICAPQTPCAWSVYRPTGRIIDMNITNNYCECASDSECQYAEDDSTGVVYRCRPAVEEDKTTDSFQTSTHER